MFVRAKQAGVAGFRRHTSVQCQGDSKLPSVLGAYPGEGLAEVIDRMRLGIIFDCRPVVRDESALGTVVEPLA